MLLNSEFHFQFGPNCQLVDIFVEKTSRELLSDMLWISQETIFQFSGQNKNSHPIPQKYNHNVRHLHQFSTPLQFALTSPYGKYSTAGR